MSHVSLTMSVASVLTLALASLAVGDPPMNNDCVNAMGIGDVCGMPFNFETNGATPSNIGCLFGGPDVFYCYTAPRTGDLNVSVSVTNGEFGVIAIYEGCGCDGSLGTQLGCESEAFPDFPAPGEGDLIYTVSVVAEQTYLVQLGGDGFTGGTMPAGTLTLFVPGAPPEIVCPPPPPPIECTSPDGETVTLDVTIEDPDSDVVTVSWEVDGDLVLTEPVMIECSAVASLTETFDIGDHTIIVTVDDGETDPVESDEITLSIQDTAPPDVRCHLIPIWWHFFHIVWYNASDACDGDPVIDAYLTAGGQQAPVQKWQIVFINCYADSSEIDGGGWILKAKGSDVALEVTATDAENNVATCTSTVCDCE
jgi:hypothetical protein